MKCPKCKGKMFAEKFYDFVRSYDAWKCYSCGEVVDPVIVANRSKVVVSQPKVEVERPSAIQQ